MNVCFILKADIELWMQDTKLSSANSSIQWWWCRVYFQFQRINYCRIPDTFSWIL